MGLARGLVLGLDRRATLAIAGVTFSIAYALIAGAAVSGLKDAQGALASDVQFVHHVAARPDFQPLDLTALIPPPDVALSLFRNETGTVFYAVTRGNTTAITPGNATVGASSHLWRDQVLQPEGIGLNVSVATPEPGASPLWVRLDTSDFVRLGGDPAATNVAVYYGPGARVAGDVVLVAAPAVVPFYESGVDQLAAAVYATVLASTVVVALVAAAFLRLELHAKATSFAVLQFFSGPRLVRRLTLARGIWILLLAHGAATGLTMGVLAALGQAGAVTLALPSAYAATALGLTFLGGLGGVGWTVLRTRAVSTGDVQGRPPSRRLGAALRPVLTTWRSLVPLAVAALVTAGSLGVIFGAAAMPFQVLGQDRGDVLANTHDNPLRGSVDAFLGEHLYEAEGFRASSPEIFAPTVIQGRAAMVRGVLWERLQSIDQVGLARGKQAEVLGDVVLGAGLAARTGLDIGDRVPLASAYQTTFVWAHITGIASASNLLKDEALVTLETARALTGLPADAVNTIRYRVDPAVDRSAKQLPATPSGVEVLDLEVNPPDPVPDEDVRVTVRILNFSPGDSDRLLTLSVNGVDQTSEWARLAPHERSQLDFRFRAPPAGRFVVSVNPDFEGQGSPPAYDLDAPDKKPAGEVFNVTVRDFGGAPVPGIIVRLDGEQATTDGDGRASLTANPVGNRTLLATGPDGRAARPIFVIDPAHLNEGFLRFLGLEGPATIRPGEWRGTADIENVGGQTYNGPVVLLIDDANRSVAQVALAPGVRSRVDIVASLEEGTHVLSAPGSNLTVRAAAPGASPTAGAPESPKTVDELLEERRERTQRLAGPARDPVQAFLGDTYENFNAALTVVVLATLLHGALVVTAAVSRDLEERRGRVGTLVSLGAPRRHLHERVLREYGLLGLGAALLGTIAGLGVATIAANAGFLQGFGHALTPRADAGFVVRLVAVNFALVVAVALARVDQAQGETVRELLTEGPSRGRRPSLQTLLEGKA